jgi:pimeloyl-ACP methyl ester carboxylesterase
VAAVRPSLGPQVAPLVAAGHRVVAYDRRGFGGSSQPWNGYDYDTLTADLHALLEHLDLRDVALVGFPMGGGEVVRYIATHGVARVSRAMLAAAVPPYLYESADNPDGGLDDATIEQFQQGVPGSAPMGMARQGVRTPATRARRTTGAAGPRNCVVDPPVVSDVWFGRMP